MMNPDDNVVHLPTPLERLALQASQAMADYKVGSRQSIHAILEYGAALAEGRALHPKGDNAAFSSWVTANGLDVGKPWDSRSERGAAMLIAKILRENGHSEKDFAECPFTRPNDMRQWYRTHKLGIAPKKRPAKAVEKAADAIAGLAAAELPLTGQTVAERAGVGETTALKAIALDARERDLLGAATFTEKGKLTLAKAIEIEKKRLRSVFYAQVQAEVRRIIDNADDHVRKRLKEVEAQLEGVSRMLRQKGTFARLEFRQLQMAVHPDNTASTEVRNRLLDLLVKNEARLVKEE